MTDDRAALHAQLIRHEGLRLRMYRCPAGALTIGVGHNLDSNPISELAARVILDDDIDISIRELAAAVPWFVNLDPVRQRSLIDLHFNLGLGRLRRFQRLLAAGAVGDYQRAADELIDSQWYQQVGARGPRVVAMLRTGQDPDAAPGES